MARFDRTIQTALKLIAKNGRVVQWQAIAPVINEAQPWHVTENAAPAPVDVTICFLPVNRVNLETFTRIPLTEVPTEAEIGLMGAVNFEAAMSGIVLRDGKPFHILSLDLLAPNGQKILHTMVLKA